jgi:hypothetical protein
MRIAEVAERTGYSPATLRYYEELELLPAPARTPAGYRTYDESVLDRLAFISRAKRLGCTLEEVAEHMPEWDGGRCAWGELTAHVTARTPIDGGIRMQLDAGTPLGDLAALMAAEQSCCAFFAFALTVDGRGVALEVRAPAQALALFGSR